MPVGRARTETELFLNEKSPEDEFRFHKLLLGSLGLALTSSEKAKESKESEKVG